MRLKRISICLCISILCSILLTGCKEGSVTEAIDTEGKTKTIESVTLEETTSESSTDSLVTSVTDEIETAMPEKLFVEDFISVEFAGLANDIKNEREEFSQNNEFIDYDYIYEPVQSSLPKDSKDRVLKLVYDKSEYIKAKEQYPLFETCNIYANLINAADEIPEVVGVYEDNFDGITGNERFIIVSLPQLEDDREASYRTNILLFENNLGDLQMLTFADSLNSIHILDYSKFKQFIFGGYGIYGFREHTAIYGVNNGTPKALIDDRIWFGEDAKLGCFLYHTGWQGFTEIMVYDTTNDKYRAIYGYPADNQKLKEIDYSKELSCLYEYDIPDDYVAFFVVDEKYLIGGGGLGSYTYENGSFKRGCVLPNWRVWAGLDTAVEWFDVDVDLAMELSGATF